MAAGSTYTPIATTTLGSATASVTFSSIVSTYTDLVLIAQIVGTATSNIALKFNNAGGTAYSNTWLGGNGTSASSSRDTSSAYIPIDGGNGYPASGETSIYNISINNYANTSIYKTLLSRANNAARGLAAVVGLWQSTAAINRIDIFVANGANLGSGSTFTLYGIQAA